MKKSDILMVFAAFVLALGCSACSNDDTPVWQKPGEFKLNTPPMAQQFYDLNQDGTIVLTTSQPDYGFVASVTYGVEIALSKDGPTYTIAPETPTSAVIRIKNSDVATGMTELRGKDDKSPWQECPLYVRATAQLGSNGDSYTQSNWITLDHVLAYYAVREPGYIYLVGSPEGWKGPEEANAAHYADWRLFEKEDEIGSHVYYGVFDFPSAPLFRFYTALTGWDADSWGSQTDDNPIEYELEADGSFTGNLVQGKGSFSFPAFGGGEVTIVVNMSTEGKYTFTMLEGNQM